MSDHHSVCTTAELWMQPTEKEFACSRIPTYPNMNWSDNRICSAYSQHMINAVASLPVVNFGAVNGRDEASSIVDTICNDVTTAMHLCCPRLISDNHERYQGRFKKKYWWNNDCLITRDRQRFWYGIWKSCGRPREVEVYRCYKAAKKVYRGAYNQAMNSNLNHIPRQINTLYRGRHVKKLWNLIRSIQKDRSSNEDIAVSKLYEYFKTKFSISECESGVISNAKRSVQEKHEGPLNVEFVCMRSILDPGGPVVLW